MIASVDESVGRVLAALDELKLAERTLVIFTSDNGGVGGYEREGIQGGSITDNAPLQGRQRACSTKAASACRTSSAGPARSRRAPSASSRSTAWTCIRRCWNWPGRQPEPGYPLDGQSYLGLLVGGRPAEADAGPLFWHFPGYLGAGGGTWRTTPAGAIRSGDWKLLEFFEDGRLELYNLREDIGEKHNLAAAQPDKVQELHARLVAWRKTSTPRCPCPIATRPPAVRRPRQEGFGRRRQEESQVPPVACSWVCRQPRRIASPQPSSISPFSAIPVRMLHLCVDLPLLGHPTVRPHGWSGASRTRCRLNLYRHLSQPAWVKWTCVVPWRNPQ